jgi:hypothetical protein
MEHTTTQPVTAETNSQPKRAWSTPSLRSEGRVAEVTLLPISGRD